MERKSSRDTVRLVRRLKALGFELSLADQRSAGAWSWFLFAISTGAYYGDLGSQYPLAEVLRRGFDTSVNRVGQISLDPNDLKKDRRL